MIKDNREFIEKLESQGELKRIKAKVDWNLEIGAISRGGLIFAVRPSFSRISKDTQRVIEFWQI